VGPVFGEDFADDVWDPSFSPKEKSVGRPPSSLPILVWCSLATGALLAGGVMLAGIGLLGDALPTVRGGYPTIPGLLFEHPVGFPSFLSVGAAGLVLVTGLAVRPRRMGAVMSVLIGLAGLLCIGVVAVSSLNIIESRLNGLQTVHPTQRQIAR
jgi:hypothetical protein